MLHSKDIIFALFLLGSTVALDVQITPSQGEISVGESKFFACEAVGVAKQIDWFAPSGDRIEPNRPGVTVSRSDESTSILTLYNADVDNAGTYKCVATNGHQQAESTVNVKIYQRITFQRAPSPQEFNETDNADIICDVISSPPPTVIWKHKGVKIQMAKDVRFRILSNNHLQIRGIKKTDEGSYTCEGRLMVRGEIDLRIIKVIVNVAPSIRVWQSEVNATADVGQAAMLSCAVDGYPEPMVTWARNGVLLEAEEKYSFNEDGSEMTIMDVAKLDEGEYTCIAKNKAGESNEELSLRVFVKPKITYLVNTSTSEMDEQVTLTCEASGDPTPTINWSFGLRVFTEGEQASWTRPEQHKSLDGNVVTRSDARLSSLTLKYAKYTDAGQYLCTARNAIGEDARPAYLEVRYAPKIHGPVTVYTWEGNAANISCEVLAHPSDVSTQWLRDGLQLPNPNTTNIRVFNSPEASYLEVTPESENDFGSYNCTATNEIGTESKEFILIQADVPSSPSIGQVEPFSSSARVLFLEPDATGGVAVLRYRAEWKIVGRGNWMQRVYEIQGGALSEVTITGLKPESSYEVQMSAINGKGEGERSPAVIFKTKPVRYSYTSEPNAPKLEGTLQPKGNALKVNWIKQDDGGSPITHYLVRFKPKHTSDWKPEIRLPSSSEYVFLTDLEWDTEYVVFVVAENQQGKSKPGTLTIRTTHEPAAIPDPADGPALSTGVIAGVLIVAAVLLLLAVDVVCFFVNKCGLIMCLCGKPGSTVKDNLEQGKAAYIKDESKEPIVEVRTEDECTANHNAGGPTEPNETTPLTEPELAAHTAALALDTLSSVATNSDTATATYDPAQDSPCSETTTLTCSFSAADPTPAPTHAPNPAHAPTPIPEDVPARQAPLISSSDITAKVSPLVDLLGCQSPKAEGKTAIAISAVESPKPQNSPRPIPPKRRNSPKMSPIPKDRPPVSALAMDSPSSSPGLDTQRRAPPVSQVTPPATFSGPDTLTPVTTPATKPAADAPTTLDTGIPTSIAHSTDKPANTSATTTKDAPTPAPTAPTAPSTVAPVLITPTILDADITAPTVLDSITPVPVGSDILTPTPVRAPASAPRALPSHGASAAYDFLAATPTSHMPAAVDPRAPEVELELSNCATSPSPPLAGPSWPESSPVTDPSVANGDGPDLRAPGLAPEDSEAPAKAAPPVYDEKMMSDEKSKGEESGMKTALSDVMGGHNDVTHLKASESKA